MHRLGAYGPEVESGDTHGGEQHQPEHHRRTRRHPAPESHPQRQPLPKGRHETARPRRTTGHLPHGLGYRYRCGYGCGYGFRLTHRYGFRLTHGYRRGWRLRRLYGYGYGITLRAGGARHQRIRPATRGRRHKGGTPSHGPPPTVACPGSSAGTHSRTSARARAGSVPGPCQPPPGQGVGRRPERGNGGGGGGGGGGRRRARITGGRGIGRRSRGGQNGRSRRPRRSKGHASRR